MRTVEIYRGTKITITTTKKKEEKFWTARAEFSFLDQSNTQVDMSSTSEEKARETALQAAVENIDRNRISIGKC